ncbi:MAG: 30S ribosomal protein S20 [Spirochaetes bacterium]|nr:30S ribosomal protein S20 [Spirochaetota bacterium]
MANIKSAQKRIKTNEKSRRKNAQVKSSVRTEAKKVQKSLESKEAKDPALLASVFAGFVKKIDKAAAKGVFHWKTAARKKSRLARKVNAAAGRQA